MRLTYLFVLSLVLAVSFPSVIAQSAARNAPSSDGTVLIWGHATAKGKPIAGAWVSLWRQPNIDPNANDMAATGRTDRDGKYQLKTPAGNYFIAATADGFVDVIRNEPLLKSLRQVRVVEGSWPQTVDLELVPAAALEGTVTDDQGKPVPQTLVQLIPVSMPTVSLPTYWRLTDLGGRYRIDGLAAGRYWIAAGELAPVWGTTFGWTPHRRTFYPDAADQSQAKLIDISPGAEINQIDINMGPALKTFTVKVRLIPNRDAHIPPYLDFMLEAFYQGQHATSAKPRGSSTTDGGIVIPNVPAGEYMVHVWSLDRPLGRNGWELANPKLLGRSDRFEVIDRDVTFDLPISVPGKP
jgi:hypothetical protein